MATLMVTEVAALKRCEATIEKGMATFVEVGRSLAEIRDGRLYRDTHNTFAAYLKDRWSMSRTRAHELIDGAKVVENVRHAEQNSLPNARQATELAKAPPEKQAEVWEAASEDGKPTAAKVKAAVKKISGGTSFDPEEIEAVAQPPKKAKPGKPVVSVQQRKRLHKALGELIRALSDAGLYDEFLRNLDPIAARLKEI